MVLFTKGEIRLTDGTTGASDLHVLGIAGSLRGKSFNRALLRAAQELAPPDILIDVFDIANVPLYNGDDEEKGDVEPVSELREAIKTSDALLVVTPEYNYGIPGVLKNSIDWASRPYGQSVLTDKPAAIMGATPGTGGTARAQLQLRQSLAAIGVLVMAQPEIFVSSAHEKFDNEGRLTDETTIKHVSRFLVSFAAWIDRLSLNRS
jgi:chromate reductase, NAD(P)H dehydrogenase (quinone)